MADISNKTIVVLLAIALIITVAGTVVSVTKLSGLQTKYTLLSGAATTGTGTSSITVQGYASIAINDATVTFPTGYYNASCTYGYARLNTNSTNASSGENFCWLNGSNIEPWNGSLVMSANMTPDYHRIENNGSTVINVTLETNETNASRYLCGAGRCASSTNGGNASVTITVYQEESGSCGSGLLAGNTTILSNSSETNVTICQDLNYENSADALNMTYMYSIPKDVDQGVKSLTITFTATAK